MTVAKPTAEERAERLHQQDCACPSDVLTGPTDRANCRRCLEAEIRAAQAEVWEEAASIAAPAPGPEPRDFQDHRIRDEVRRWLADLFRQRAAALWVK